MGKIISVQELDTVTFGEGNKKIGEVNPFRYCGYYYDMETGFYYLNSDIMTRRLRGLSILTAIYQQVKALMELICYVIV